MVERQATRPGAAGTSGDAAEAADPFRSGKLWVGEHAADGDILVFDPAESSSADDRVSFYSMTQFRTRVFPRPLVTRQIREVTDDIRSARARQDYNRREELRVTHESELAAARAALVDRQREEAIHRHERYLTGHGIAYQGVQMTTPERKRSKRVKCHACGIPLDDFARSVCGVCKDVLCSCGACACARTRAT